MADLSIRKDFVDGVQEIFTTLFNGGEDDGVTYYELDLENSKTNIYGEAKYKQYINPVMLVCKAEISPTHGAQTVESVKDSSTFTIPLKSLQERNLGVTTEELEHMRRGILEFHGTFYYIDNISPKAYIEDVFLMYKFDCTQILDAVSNFMDVYSDDDEENILGVQEDSRVIRILIGGK